MSLSHLLQKVDAKGVFKVNTEITMDSTFTGSAELNRMLASSIGEEVLKIKTKSLGRPEDNSFLKFIGTANLLGLTEAAIMFLATDNEGDLRVILEVTLPKGWHFTQSFPFLPGYYDASQSEDKRMGLLRM